MNEGFSTGLKALIVLTETTAVVEPGEGALDNPAAREHFEALLVIRTKHKAKPEREISGYPIEQLTTIATIDPDQAQFLASAA